MSDSQAAPPLPSRIRASRRHRAVRARTISVKRLPAWELREGALLYPDVEGVERPTTRADCAGGERPCPFVSCVHHLYLDVSPRTGSIKLNFPDLEPDEMRDSCVLDVADRGGATLEAVGEIMNLTRERTRQLEEKGLRRIKADATLAEYVDGDRDPRRHLRVVP